MIVCFLPLFFLILLICLCVIYPGQGTSEGKRALYHCNYCNKDITGKIRIKCYVCPDFDLCVECFSVGAEVQPHKSNHPYRVMVSKITTRIVFLLTPCRPVEFMVFSYRGFVHVVMIRM